MLKPYVGITDFAKSSQSWMMLEFLDSIYDTVNPIIRRLLMIGVMMSRKTLYGLPSQWTDIFPPNNSIKRIFVPHPLAKNTLHYADYENLTSVYDLLRATDLSGPSLNALQLDMILPAPEMLAKYRKENPDIEIVLQMGKEALNRLEYSPEKFETKLKEYSGLAHYILLDESMGRGVGMNADNLMPFVGPSRTLDFKIAFAGGLGPTTCDLVEPLMKICPDLSVDAQSKLRPSGSAKDPIDWDYAKMYIRNIVALSHRITP